MYDTSGTLLHTFTDPGVGTSVAAVGNDVLLGARDVNFRQGVAYLYNTSGTLLHTFTDPNATNSDQFGESVAAFGNQGHGRAEIRVTAWGRVGSRSGTEVLNR